jgi:large repetitive protein
MTASVTATGGPVTGPCFQRRRNANCQRDLANGSAIAHVSNLSVGQHPLTATYGGNGNWQGSTSATVIQTVAAVQVGTTTTLSANINPSVYRQPVPSGTSAAGIWKRGAYGYSEFHGGQRLVGLSGSDSGTAGFPILTLAAGTHSMQAAYQEDESFTPSQSAQYTQTVSGPDGAKVTPTVDLTVNGSSTGATVFVGDTVTFVARIHAPADYPWPTGSIRISGRSGNTYGTANNSKDPNSNDGLATIMNSGLAAKSYTLVPVYGGDGGNYYYGAQSNTVSLEVVKPKG